MKNATFKVSGMHCASCAGIITRKISKLAGVESCQVNLATEEAKVAYDESKVKVADFNQEIDKFGYSFQADKAMNDADHMDHMNGMDHSEHAGSSQSKEQKMRMLIEEKKETEFVLPIALLVFVVMIWELIAAQIPTLPKLPLPMELFNVFSFILATIILFQFGKPFISAVGRFARHKVANMDTLVGIGTMTAYFYSSLLFLFPQIKEILRVPEFLYFDVTIVVIGFIKLGKYLESRSKLKTGEAIEKLLHLGAKTALVVRNGEQIEVPIEEVLVGETLIVKPGQKVPVDGLIVKGASSIDESMVTGESIPVDKTIKDIVIGGTLNKQSTFTMEASKVGEDMMLSQIVKMVKEAQGSKAPIERLADQISAVFVPITLVFSVLVLLAWAVIGSMFMPISQAVSFGIISFVGILVIACPCALGLATPTAIIVGVGKAAQNGILIKNAESLEKFNQVNYIIFDKTGTLTKGKPEVIDTKVVGDLSERSVYRILGSLENESEHPLASAVVMKAKEIIKKFDEVTSFSNLEGKGVQGKVDGKKYYAGSLKLMEDKKFAIDKTIISQFASQGKTPVLFADEKKILAYLSIADTIKEDAKDLIIKLHKLGIKVAMLTGDNKQTAKYIADSIGIDEVIAEVLPADKAKEVKRVQAGGHVVAMVGDGINDAPALATADVGVAMGTGTDVAIESAGITLLSGNLAKLESSVVLARKTMSIVKQNLFWAFFYNVIGIPIAAGILYPFFGIMLNPAIAGGAMAFSSVSVVANSLRLKTAKI